ncbi:MAG: alpha/beta fold hydrolase [Flavobacteriaceae bacterium]
MIKKLFLLYFVISQIQTSCNGTRSISEEREDSVFVEYRIREFNFEGRDAKIVFPKKRHEKDLWVWRARFWGHEPQFDKALIEKGFHLVYVDVADMFGNNEAVGIWNRFYEYCRSKYRLNEKVVLEGMSRGGLIVYNWGSKNPSKVLAIYGDAPVCDIKSWPGGLGKGKGHAETWKRCLDAYGLDTVSVLDFKGIPVNNYEPLAKAGVPLIHVYGDTDKVVPFEENSAILAARYRAAGGSMELIRKEGVGHHPHSLQDPSPIVDFVLKALD